jgi:hypothetical protein
MLMFIAGFVGGAMFAIKNTRVDYYCEAADELVVNYSLDFSNFTIDDHRDFAVDVWALSIERVISDG